MAQKILVDADIERGRELVRVLDAEGYDVSAALWFYHPEREEYRLLIESSRTALDRRKAYAELDRVLNAHPDLHVRLSEITLAAPDNLLVQTLRHQVQTGPDLESIRMTNNVIFGQLVEDVFIYRLLPVTETQARASRP